MKEKLKILRELWELAFLRSDKVAMSEIQSQINECYDIIWNESTLNEEKN